MNEPLRARKSLGQNFLVDPAFQRRIVDALELTSSDTVVEIGPGQGALTRHLVEQAGRVVAIELDDRLAPRLREEFKDRDGFELVHGDALQVDLAALELGDRVKFVGNIPYNITTPLLFKLLLRSMRPSVLVVMVQKEVAVRITAPPGNKEYGALSVGVQSIADAERLFNVPRGAFRPVPGVDSAVLRIVPHEPPRVTADEEADLRALTRTVFSQRRKQLQRILRSAPEYELDAADVIRLEAATGIDFNDRPEMLAPEQFVALARVLRADGRPWSNAA